jgi:hypothetical protein
MQFKVVGRLTLPIREDETISEFSLIVNDFILLISSYVNFEVKFVRRQTNLVAHTVAKAVNI